MLKLELKDEVNPLCPHCQTSLALLWFRELKGAFGKRYIYFCPHCKKVLGVSHRKGFWMG